MKITINTNNTKSLPKSEDALKKEIAKKEIAEKLNRLAACNTLNFFSWDGDTLGVRSCSNTDVHNKLVILVSLFTDSSNNKYCTYTSFGDGVNFCGWQTIEGLESLNDFVDSVPDPRTVAIEIN